MAPTRHFHPDNTLTPDPPWQVRPKKNKKKKQQSSFLLVSTKNGSPRCAEKYNQQFSRTHWWWRSFWKVHFLLSLFQTTLFHWDVRSPPPSNFLAINQICISDWLKNSLETTTCPSCRCFSWCFEYFTLSVWSLSNEKLKVTDVILNCVKNRSQLDCGLSESLLFRYCWTSITCGSLSALFFHDTTTSFHK